MCLCVCLLFFGHSFAWNENTNFLISCSLTTQKRKRSIQLLKGKLVTLNKKPSLLQNMWFLCPFWSLRRGARKYHQQQLLWEDHQDLKMEFEHLLFKREAEEDKGEKKEVGAENFEIFSHFSQHNSISIFHPQSIIKKVEHELEKDVNLVAEKTHMKPWWVKNKLKTLRSVGFRLPGKVA